VRAALREFFARWGLPDGLRLDNGHPWGSPRDLPTDLALWLIGLGVEPHWNRPRHCEANGIVERDHGVLARWSEPATCPDAATLAARLAAAATVQREAYPVGGARTPRLRAYPGLAVGGRPYDPAHERRQWDVRRVWRWFAARSWRRTVDKVGRISLYNRALGVGRAWAGQTVHVTFDPDQVAWIIQDAHGNELRRHAAPELRSARVWTMTVAGRRDPAPAVEG
jgi:transposase InsO family protein